MDHIRIDDVRATEAELAARPEAAGAARRLLETLGRSLDQDVVERAQLLVIEVVANSVRHGSTSDPIHVSVEARPETLHVQVSDSGPSFEPEVHRPDIGSESGWGCSSSTRSPIGGASTSTATSPSGSRWISSRSRHAVG